MSLVPLQHRIELYINGAWVDVSTYLLDRPVTPTGGTSDEARRLVPGTFGFELDNSDGRFTPGNPTSPYYGSLGLNTPVRWSLAAGLPHLTVTGAASSRATTPDDASLDITTDWFLAVEAEPPVSIPASPSTYEIYGKFNPTGNQRSILLGMQYTGKLRVRWSTDGTAATEKDAFSSIALPQRLWSTRAFAAWLDVDNGASGHTCHFYVADTLAQIIANPAGTEFGTAFVESGTTSVFSSTAPLDIGDITGSGFLPYPGGIRKAQARNGKYDGTIVANPDFTAQTVGATSFVDSAGRTWSITSPATIDKWQTRQLGEIVSNEPDWTEGDPGLPTVKVTASGTSRRLGQRDKALKSALTRKTMAPYYVDNLTAHWPWEDGSDSSQAASSMPGVAPMQVAGFRFHGDDSLPATDGLANLAAGQSGGFNARVPVGPAGSDTDWSINWFVNIPQMNATTYPLMVATGNGTAHQWVIQVNSTDVIVSATDIGGGGVVLTTFPWDGVKFIFPSLLRLHANTNGGNVDWKMEWIPIYGPTAGTSFGPGTLSFAGTCGRATNLALLMPAAPPGGISMGQFSVTTGTVDGFLAPADRAYAGEAAAARWKRICDEEQIAALVEGTLTDSALMGPQPIASLTDVLEDCARTDGGMQAEQRHAAGIGLRTLRSLYNQTPRITFDVDAGDVGLPFGPKLDDQRIHNDVTAQRTNGSSVRVTTTPPPAQDQVYDGTVDANVDNDGLLLDVAYWELHLGTTPQDRHWMRYPTVRTDLVSRDALVDDYLHSGPGDTFQVLNIPQHAPDAVVLLREGDRENVDTTHWDIELTSSPGLLYEVGVRDSTSRGKRDSGDSTLSADFIAGTNTSMTVAIASGLLWTTAGGDFPLELDVGGARITVTAISGASSPQTFTVSATVVNGVAKTVPAGTKVRLWRPTVRAR